MIDSRDIDRLAELARIDLPTDEREALTRDIEAIVAYVSEIRRAPEAPPAAPALANVFREDGEPHAPGAYTETLLAAAPNRSGEYVAVKAVLP